MITESPLQLAAIETAVCDVVATTLSLPRDEVLPSSRIIEDLRCDSLDLSWRSRTGSR